MTIQEEIGRRRTFAIISHPDAGKTTLTEKFLLYGGAIAQAGQVKGKKNARAATSDWMEIEKQRGISVTSSVMQFQYEGYCINILDTPGHQDFSEDTYRTLMAADSALMVIDAAKGVEAQTRKLFHVCAARGIPIFTFINKLDREAQEPFTLLEEIEKELGIETCPMNWPVGSGRDFQGVFDRERGKFIRFEPSGGSKKSATAEIDLNDPALPSLIGKNLYEKLQEDAELIEGAAAPFHAEKVRRGELSPVYFGSALTNFGVEPFLESFLKISMPPSSRLSGETAVDAQDAHFSAFIFKIQANMNKAHRDRIAFLRIVSGKFDADQEVYHVQGGRTLRLSRPQQLMAAEREIISEAYAGDVIGVFDPGIFSIGDTLCTPGDNVRFDAIPQFPPEHFRRVRPLDTLKRKQFIKGTEQIAQEGAVRLFKTPYSGMEELIIGVVGTLQFDVLEYRLLHEYGVEIRREDLPYEFIRRVFREDGETIREEDLTLGTDTKLLEDTAGKQYLVFGSRWAVNWFIDKNPGVQTAEYSRV